MSQKNMGTDIRSLRGFRTLGGIYSGGVVAPGIEAIPDVAVVGVFTDRRVG